MDQKRWQEITNTCLVRRGTKTAIANNSARGYDAGHGSFIDPSKSQIAHQTWRCVHYGAQSAPSIVAELQPPSKRRKIRVPNRGCNFQVYAKFIPFLNKVRCTVTPHVGEGSYGNEHNHELGKSLFRMYKQNRKLEGDDKARQKALMILHAPPRVALE